MAQVKKKAAVTVWRPRDEVQSRWTSYASDNAADGTVSFADAPGGNGTEVYLEVEQNSIVGAALKTIGEEPYQRAKDSLHRFKQIVETGEIIRSEASPEGETHKRILPRQRPAQPLEHAEA
ncbi:MAG TPA: hypothetical protein VFM58_24545 [Solirubrobacteraceae bacterium]|nr:hypothetical protein [Solirubrobacteraceae bacterium]